MSKQKKEIDDSQLMADPAYTPGRWHLFFVPGGFTMIGRYVKPLSLGLHRWAEVRHMRNAGNQELPEICRVGVKAATFTRSSWREYNCIPIGYAPYDGKLPEGWGLE